MKIELLETAGWYTVFKNLRQSYSLDSRSNLKHIERSNIQYIPDTKTIEYTGHLVIDNKDLQLLSTLVKRGDSHSKIIRGLQTYVEITAPRYWWQEWLTYVIGVLEINPTIDWVSLNSESTMHTLKKEVSNRRITGDGIDIGTEYGLSKDKVCEYVFDYTLENYNDNTNNMSLEQLKANLPEGYLQTRTFQVSYQAWRRIYMQRANHKLEEWNTNIVEFIESLPFSKELITVNNGE